HYRDHRNQPGDARHDALVNRIGAQRGSDGALFQVLDAGRQRTRSQIPRKVHRLLFATEACDAARILDLALNRRDADDLVVQHHCQLIADVGFGVAAEPSAAVLRKIEARLPLAEFILAGTRVAHLAAGDHGRLADDVPLFAVTAAARLGL